MRRDKLNIPETEALLTDIGEAFLDTALTSDLLRELPLVGIATNLTGAVREVRDALFLRKAKRLLCALKGTNAESAKTFLEGMRGDSERAQRLRFKVLEWIEAIDDSDKAELLGEVLRAHIEGKLDLHQTRMLAHAVLVCFPSDLMCLGKSCKPNRDGLFDLPSTQASRLTACGLVEQASVMPPTIGPGGPGEFRYRVTALGDLLRATELPAVSEKLAGESGAD